MGVEKSARPEFSPGRKYRDAFGVLCGFFTGGVSVVDASAAAAAAAASFFCCFLLLALAFVALAVVGAGGGGAAVVGVVGVVGEVVVLEPGVVAGVVAWKLLLGAVEIGT